MADRRPLVVKSGEVQQLQSSDFLVDPLLRHYGDYKSLLNNDGTTINFGEICYLSGVQTVKKAKADAALTISHLCFATETILNGNFGMFQFYGNLEGIFSPVLVVGVDYFLSPATAGLLTATVPTTAGHYIVKLGFAWDAARFHIKIERPILLS